MNLFGRRRDVAVDSDPAGDDVPLRQAVTRSRDGDWEPARDLLAASRHDYDRRAHLIAVIAASTARDGDTAWPDVWAGVEPRNPDALLLHARSLIARDRRLPAALTLTEQAANLAPDDPTPWSQRLLLMTALGADRATRDAGWHQVIARDPWHREAHGHRLTHLCRRTTGATTHDDMFAFTHETASAAPTGSPLLVLPLAAANEWALWETHHGDGAGTMNRALQVIRAQRGNPGFHAAVETAYTGWFQQPATRHALWHHDLNLLAQALHRAEQHTRARPVFDAIGPYFDPEPWRYVGGEQTFQDASRKASPS
ncbi:hypothetical protein ACTI_62510 [Actinoplanes sp. OR16]|uniref:DUF4034 domain-containing protein n=1 Tax=Actinoplanes sp. OR16 TaxID=946334 RepID=UPI000F6EF3EB|nr:DUF4034 domain-containing protein [Actinoplanes sp. OR16]BBH69566.1 hypothetical protein ACTI_62510 [Actinoplanes sp. OR16]